MAMGSIVTRVADGIAATGASVTHGRPVSAIIDLSVEAGAHGIPRTDVPALARIRQTFRIAPTAEHGLLELQMPTDQFQFLGAKSSVGQALAGKRVNDTLLLERPAGMEGFTLTTALESAPAGPLRLEYDRLHFDDLTATIKSGAETTGPPPHFRTGIVPPDEREVMVRFGERGWELPSTSLERSGADYVHPLDERLQASFRGPRNQDFNGTAQYTGQVDGHASEGRIADLRRGAKAAVSAAGIFGAHALEGLR